MQTKLTVPQLEVLDEHNWGQRTGVDPAIWVSVADQCLRLIQDGEILWDRPCSTAEKGVGSEMDSFKTPSGWHSVAGKIGQDEPWGRVFRARVATETVWQPGETVSEDLVLTRILLLEGEEPGLNKGGKVDSRARHIYVHGTNDEERIGQPTSHGCIRLRNDDVIELFDLVAEGTPLLITDDSPCTDE